LLAKLLLGLTVLPCAEPPGTLFALRTCITAQPYSQWGHTDHLYGYLYSIPYWSFYLLKQWLGCVAVVQLVMLQNCWNHWKCYEPPFLLTVYLTSFVPLLTMDSAGCQACVEHSHHSETCQQNTKLTLHNSFQQMTRKHFWLSTFTSNPHLNKSSNETYKCSNMKHVKQPTQ
jgi:hypothetical protein